MAATSSLDAGARRGPHPLALAYLTVFILLIVAGAGITFLGDPHAGVERFSPRFGPRVSQQPRRESAAQRAGGARIFA